MHNDRFSLTQISSETIKYLRFPLIIGVIFIHANGGWDISTGNFNDYKLFNYLSTLFSEVIGRISVPLFYLISGYLFFYKIDNFSKTIYFKKLNKRVNSLLIPYLFWNILTFLIYNILFNLQATQHYITGAVANKLDYNFISGLMGLYDGKLSTPWAYQFWFIRDLLFCVLLSPIIYYCISKIKLVFIISLGLLWYCDHSILGFELTSIFFFSLGGYLCKNKLDIVILSRELKIVGLSYPFLVILDVLTKEAHINAYIHNLGILSGIIGVVLIVSYLIETHKIKPLPFLTSASFFVFACHEPLLTCIKKLLVRFIPIKNDFMVCISYFALVGIVIIISLSMYYVLMKLCPKFTSFIKGGR